MDKIAYKGEQKYFRKIQKLEMRQRRVKVSQICLKYNLTNTEINPYFICSKIYKVPTVSIT